MPETTRICNYRLCEITIEGRAAQARFCSEGCRTRERELRRNETDPDRRRRWYAANRDHVREYRASRFAGWSSSAADIRSKYAKQYQLDNDEHLRGVGRRRKAQIHADNVAARMDRVCAREACAGVVSAHRRPNEIYCSTECRLLCRSEYGAIWIAKNHSRHAATSKQWMIDNPLKRTLTINKRRAAIASSASVSFTLEQMTARFAYYGFACWMCGAPWESMDHVKPLSKGGPHLLANLRPACTRCNSSKGAKWLGVSGVNSFKKRPGLG